MLIRYIHAASPKQEKIHNTQKAFRNSSWFFRGINANITQEEYDAQELAHMEQDKQRGVILSYEIID